MSIEAQVSQIIVIVVLGEEYVEGILTIPTLSTADSCRLTIIPFLNIAVKSVATVIVVLLALVPVTAVRREVPQPQPPVAFKVVQVNERFVQSVISSIAPVLAVPLPSNLPVVILLVNLASTAVFTAFCDG